jgi:hypothetical protein
MQEISHQKGVSDRDIELTPLVKGVNIFHPVSLDGLVLKSNNPVSESLVIQGYFLYDLWGLDYHQDRDCDQSTHVKLEGSAGDCRTAEVISFPPIVDNHRSDNDTQSRTRKSCVVLVNLIGSDQSLLLPTNCDFQEYPEELVRHDD